MAPTAHPKSWAGLQNKLHRELGRESRHQATETQNETKSGMVTEGGTQEGRHWLPRLPATLKPSFATRKSKCSGLSELP